MNYQVSSLRGTNDSTGINTGVPCGSSSTISSQQGYIEGRRSELRRERSPCNLTNQASCVNGIISSKKKKIKEKNIVWTEFPQSRRVDLKNVLKGKDAEFFDFKDEIGLESADEMKYVSELSLRNIADLLKEVKKKQFLTACGLL